jgi:hypothetical protein
VQVEPLLDFQSLPDFQKKTASITVVRDEACCATAAQRRMTAGFKRLCRSGCKLTTFLLAYG